MDIEEAESGNKRGAAEIEEENKLFKLHIRFPSSDDEASPIAQKPLSIYNEPNGPTIWIQGFEICDHKKVLKFKKFLVDYYQSCGVSRLYIPLYSNDEAKGFAFMSFTDGGSVVKALKLPAPSFEDETLKVYARGGHIQITGFNRSVGADLIHKSLEDHFTPCGHLVRVDVPMNHDDNNDPKWVAHMTFDDAESLGKALALDGSDCRGDILKVNLVGPT